MTESYQRAIGRRVISRASAQELGSLRRMMVALPEGQVTAIIIGTGKKARLVEWPQLSGFGPDAIVVADEGAMRPPGNDHEREAAIGKRDALGKRVLTEFGTELGDITDVTFDPDSGVVDRLQMGDRYLSAATFLGCGTYAAVVDATQEPPG